jgi:alpha-L-rhamnosidase
MLNEGQRTARLWRTAVLAVAAVAAAGAPAVAAAAASPPGLNVADLTCEYRGQPIDVDVDHPRLAWVLASDDRGAGQSAYEVLVASTPDGLAGDTGDLWDSGRVASTETLGVPYAGRPLAALQRCFWKVRVWDGAGRPSAWSEPASWDMGLPAPTDWTGRWIADPATTATTAPAARPLPIFRRRVDLAKPVRRATVSICGLGQFELRVNGHKVGDDVLQPGWTDYAKTDLYVTYDVTDLLRPGENAVGVMLGGGMYDVGDTRRRYAKFRHHSGPLTLVAQLNMTYADGTTEVVGTDPSWRVAPGPVTFADAYGGEDDDARLEPPGWDASGFDDAAWAPAAVVAGPGGRLRGSGRSAPPVRVDRVLDPVAVTRPVPDVTVYDLGQNCAVVPRITVQGPVGSRVRITPGEALGKDGRVSQRSMGGGPVYFTYTLRGGDGDQTWSPRFAYIGSRYLQVDLTPATTGGPLPTVASVQGEFVTTTAPAVGTFACSSELFNRTFALIRWAQRSNLVSVLTDCPHRERLGWLEQDHLNGPSLMDDFALPALFEKVAGDMADAQRPDGLVPDIAPEYVTFKGGFLDSPEWGSAAVLVPWQAYQWYGDRQVLADHYDVMRRYVDHLATKAGADGVLNYGLGDWYDIGPKPPGVAQLTPVALTATAFYCHDLDVMSRVAAALGRADDAGRWAARREGAVAAFNGAFYHRDDHSYATGSQTSNAIPLVMGFAPQDDRGAILGHLVDDVRRHGNGLTSGDVGYRYLLRALADGGRSDVIFDMNSRSDRPGYGYQLAHGATALTEAWDARPSSSLDHFMLGHLVEWFYGDLAGIAEEPDAVAFDRIRIRPTPVGDVTWAKATYDSARGRIASSWRKPAGGPFTLDVTIPPGTTATVYIPGAAADKVTEGGQAASAAPGVRPLRFESGCAVFGIASGTYSFASP